MRDSYVDAPAQQTQTDGWARFCRTAAAGSDSTQVLVIATKGVDMYLDTVQLEETSTQRVYSEYRASYSIARNQEGGGGVANQWYAGDGMMSVGAVTGDGWLDCYAIRGTKSASEIGPACVANVRIGSSFNDWTPFAAWGNLDGLYGISGTRWGFRAGYQPLTAIGADSVEGFTIKNNGTAVFQADTSGNLSLTGNQTIGTNGIFRTASATALTTGTGIYMAGGTTPVFRVGVPTGNEIKWDGTDLTVKSNNFAVNTNGVFINHRTSGTFDAGAGYNWTSSYSGQVPSIWVFEDGGALYRQMSIDNISTSSSRATQTVITSSAQGATAASLNINSGLSGTAGVMTYTGTNAAFVLGGNFTIDGNVGVTATVSCGGGQAVKTLTTHKGIVIATPTCGAP
jgi:hypothetical protein